MRHIDLPPSHLRPDKTLVRTVTLTVASGVAQLLLAVAFAFSAREVSPRAYGGVVVAISIGQLLAGLSDFGLSTYLVRQVASAAMPAREMSQRLLGRLTLTGVVGTVAAAVGASFGQGRVDIVSLVALAAVLGQAAQVPLRAAAQERLAVVLVLERVLMVVSFIALQRVLGTSVLDSLWLGMVIGSSAAALCGLVLATASTRLTLERPARNPWRGASNIGLYQVALTAQTADLPLLAMFGGSTAAGMYGAVNRWIAPLGLLGNAFATSALPVLSGLHDAKKAWARIRTSVWLLVVPALLALFVALESQRLTVAVLGTGYRDSHVVLRLLALGAVVALANQVLSALLLGLGKEKTLGRSAVLLVAAQMASIAVLGPLLGGVSGAVAYLTFQVVFCFVLSASLARHQSRSTTTLVRIEEVSS